METRDTIYEEVMDRGFNYELNTFVQSYESQTTLDSAVLIAPLVFFMSPNDPQFLGTLDKILQSPEKGGLTSAGFVFRYDHEKTDDGALHHCKFFSKSPNPLVLSFHESIVWLSSAYLRICLPDRPTILTSLISVSFRRRRP